MNKRIIIEGCDKTGKSTVCKLLSVHYAVPIVKMPDMPAYFKTGKQEEASEIFSKAIAQFSWYPFILDRCYPSSLVYSSYFARDYEFDYLYEVIRKLDAKIYVLDVAPRVDDDLITSTDQQKIRELYLSFSKRFNWTVIDCTGKTPNDIANIIIKDVDAL